MEYAIRRTANELLSNIGFLKTTGSTDDHKMITSFLDMLKKAVVNKYPNIGAEVLPPHVMLLYSGSESNWVKTLWILSTRAP